jgi:hypothetical protein
MRVENENARNYYLALKRLLNALLNHPIFGFLKLSWLKLRKKVRFCFIFEGGRGGFGLTNVDNK